MKVEASLPQDDLRALPSLGQRTERLGFDGVTVSEVTHNPFIGLALVAERPSGKLTKRGRIGPWPLSNCIRRI